MSHVVVIAFDDADEAGEVRKSMRELERQEALSLEDAAVVVKDEEGKVHVKGETDRAVGAGAVGGGLLGLLLAGLFAPIGGIVLGAAGGALIGKMLDLGIDKKFVEDVGEALQPGGSALLMVIRGGNPTAVLGALKPHKGKVLQSTLPTDAEEQLERVLKREM
jgi:uncharacterized membrane protein